jgi:hypothetical protein
MCTACLTLSVLGVARVDIARGDLYVHQEN